jgi:hypothetical protein
MRCRLESSVALGGSRSLLSVPSAAQSADASNRSRLRSSTGLVGGGTTTMDQYLNIGSGVFGLLRRSRIYIYFAIQQFI